MPFFIAQVRVVCDRHPAGVVLAGRTGLAQPVPHSWSPDQATSRPRSGVTGAIRAYAERMNRPNLYRLVRRLAAGVGVLAVTLVAAFGWAFAQIPTWGATPAEVARRLPGDDLAPDPLLLWTNAIDIDAPPEAVWPWVAQMGDTRGGFYSYTFIEDRVGALMGAAGYAVDYENADRIHPEWQHPTPGDSFIQGSQVIAAVVPGQSLLSTAADPSLMQWTWIWRLDPIDDGQRTRLLVRFRIQLPTDADNPVLTGVMTAGGFVMQQRMLHGLKLRAEGGVEPVWMEAAEIGLWLTTLVLGLAAAVLYLTGADWRRPLGVATLAVAALVVMTFVQPDLWIRLAVIGMLVLALLWARQRQPQDWPDGQHAPTQSAGAGAVRMANSKGENPQRAESRKRLRTS